MAITSFSEILLTLTGDKRISDDVVLSFLEQEPKNLVIDENGSYCSICLDSCKDVVFTDCCNKIFCNECLQTWLSLNDSCPMCRTKSPAQNGSIVHVINTSNEDGATPLLLALENKRSEKVIFKLLDLGSDINARDINDWSPAMEAMRYYGEEVQLRILDMSPNAQKFLADIAFMNSKLTENVISKILDEKTALIAFEWCENEEILLKIIDSPKFNINFQDEDGRTATMLAILSERSEDLILKLLDLKPDVNLQDDELKTIFHHMIVKQYSEIVLHKLLDLKPDVNFRDYEDYTAAIDAFHFEVHEDVLLKILDLNCDINFQDPKGYTPAMLAFMNNLSPKVLHKILDLKPDVNIRNVLGDSITTIALKKFKHLDFYPCEYNEYREILKKILEFKPFVSINTAHGSAIMQLSPDNRIADILALDLV